MSLPSAYLELIESLNSEVLQANPTDILQFCANSLLRRLQIERTNTQSLLSTAQQSPMSGSTFPGRLGTNSNPFGDGGGGIGGKDQMNTGAISKVIEEDEDDTITSPTTSTFGFTKSNSAFGGPFGGDASADGPPSSFKTTDGFPAHYGMGRRTSVSAESHNPTASSNDNWSPPFHAKTNDQIARLRAAISGNFLFSHLDDEQTSQVLGALVEKPIPAKGIKVSGLVNYLLLPPPKRGK